MDIFKLVSKIKEKVQKPKIYSLLLVINIDTYTTRQNLWMGIAYSLEGALQKARLKIMNEMPVNASDIKLTLWAIKDIHNIISEATDTKIEKNDEKNIEKIKKKIDKNILLHKIIQDKDIQLFEDNKSIFTANEIKLITDSLTKRS